MHYKNTTQTPNSLFDIYLKTISESELKVLLTIIRKTVGMSDSTSNRKRKERAWISQKLFAICTGLTGRSVSTAIEKLVNKNLILVTDKTGKNLKHRKQRRAASKLYYASNSLLAQTQKQTSEYSCKNREKNLHTIKLNSIKPSCENSSQGIKKLSDTERYQELLRQSQLQKK